MAENERILQQHRNFIGIMGRFHQETQHPTVETNTVINRTARNIHLLPLGYQRSMISYFIGGLARDNQTWNVDTRDLTLQVLDKMDFGIMSRLDIHILKNKYIQAVNSLDKKADTLGPVDSLLDAGEILAPYIASDRATFKAVSKAWKSVEKVRKGDQAWQAVSPKVDDITTCLALIYIEESFRKKDTNALDGDIAKRYREEPGITIDDIRDEIVAAIPNDASSLYTKRLQLAYLNYQLSQKNPLKTSWISERDRESLRRYGLI